MGLSPFVWPPSNGNRWLKRYCFWWRSMIDPKECVSATFEFYVDIKITAKPHVMTSFLTPPLVFFRHHYPGWDRARNRLWSDHPRQVGPLIRPSQTEVTSDQTRMRSKIIVRSKCARSRLWSGDFQTEVTPDQTSSRLLSRRVPDHCPD